MNILILNWRDIKNPTGGGAEILTHEMAKRWVTKDNTVYHFSSFFSGAKKEEIVDGVKLIRKGKWWTVHFHAFIYYLQYKAKFDVIIDEVHWFPFFAYLYAPKKTIALTCEVASKLFFSIFPTPIAYIFLLVEKFYLYLYKNSPTMVISNSTKQDLLAAGHNNKNIEILPMGITIPKGTKTYPKENVPTFISVGRLNKQKGTLDLIEAFREINKSILESKLWLVGTGEPAFTQQIKNKIDEYSLGKNAILLGFVSEQKKFELLARAQLMISASTQEGWGLTIPEAGYVKTPSVVYNVQGFKDIIVHNKSGMLVEPNPKKLAQTSIKLVQDKKRYEAIQWNIYEYAKSATWDQTADVAIKFITKEIIEAQK